MLNEQFKKTYSTLTNAINKTIFDNGALPICYYKAGDENDASIRTECKTFFEDLFTHLMVMKKCESNSYENGCVPDYQWTNSAGCAGFESSSIKNNKAYVLNDGSIVFFYQMGATAFPLIGFDVNGSKGPNKPGFDVYAMAITYDKTKSLFQFGDSSKYIKNCTSIAGCLPYMGGVQCLSDIMGK